MSYEQGNTYYWWDKSLTNAHAVVFEYLKYLDQNQMYRQSDNLRFMKLYGNYPTPALASFNFAKAEGSHNNVANRVTLNVIQSMIDTVVSKITKNKPKPMFLTAGGDWSLQNKAKKLNKFCEGQFNDTDFYDKASFAFLDACVFGTGAIKIFADDQHRIQTERVFIDEIIIDDSESMYGEPRQIHQKKYIHRDVLKEMFPDKSKQIDVAGSTSSDTVDYTTKGARVDMLLVIESWHLPSGPKAKDGKHMISIDSTTLFEEEYHKDYFPFIFFKWGRRPIGFFGQGLSEQLQGIQLEINKILRTIQVSMHLVSVPKLLVEASSKVVTAHLNNKIGGIIKYAGTKPEYGKLGSIPDELFSHLDRLYSRAYEIAGISQLSAQSQKPAGLDSGKALREYNDIESERFLDVGVRYEKVFLDASKIMIDIAKDLYSDNHDYEVRVKGGKFLETIKWSDIDLEDDKYMMTAYPTSMLSSTPSGKLQDVQELIQAGFISKEDGMKLLDFPDLEGFQNLANAAAENIDKVISDITEKGHYTNPEPYQNLQYGTAKLQEAYLHYKNQGLPDSKLELFRRWIEDAEALLAAAVQDVQAPIEGDAAPVSPLASPETAPTSDIVPLENAQPPVIPE